MPGPGSFHPFKRRVLFRVGSYRGPTMSRISSTKSGSGLSLKVSTRCGSSPKAAKCTTAAGLAHPGGLGHRPRRPAGGVRRRLLKRPEDDCFDRVVANGAGMPSHGSSWSPSSRSASNPCPPLAHRGPIYSQAHGCPRRKELATPRPESRSLSGPPPRRRTSSSTSSVRSLRPVRTDGAAQRTRGQERGHCGVPPGARRYRRQTAARR